MEHRSSSEREVADQNGEARFALYLSNCYTFIAHTVNEEFRS